MDNFKENIKKVADSLSEVVVDEMLDNDCKTGYLLVAYKVTRDGSVQTIIAGVRELEEIAMVLASASEESEMLEELLDTVSDMRDFLKTTDNIVSNTLPNIDDLLNTLKNNKS